MSDENRKKRIKTFVLDTNVLIHKPDAFLSFKDNEVVIPLYVLEELDNLKTSPHEKGFSARQAIRHLDAILPKNGLHQGIKIENGITFYIESMTSKLPDALLKERMDNKIIGVAKYLQEEKGKEVYFVSKDINARVKASALGLHVVDYEKQKVNMSDLYPGWKELNLTSELISNLKENGSISTQEDFFPNQFALINSKNSKGLISRYDVDLERLILTEELTLPICGIKPLNDAQAMSMNLLLDPTVQLVTLVGKAGTGKTLIALACGIKQILDDKSYSKMMVSRPVIPMGKDIGFLPGDKKDKLANWMRPIFDNLEYITSIFKSQEFKNADTLINQKRLEVEALTYIRGRSLPDQYIIIDEAQNLTPHEVKTIVSRAGKGSKIVLTGDPYQIDNPYLDANSNGLTYLVEKFKGERIFGHITLEKTERSELAKLAAEIL